MRTPSLLGIVLFCLSAMAAAMDNDYWSNVPKHCGNKRYRYWYQIGRYCVQYFNTPLSFSDAEAACRQKASRSHLLSVHSEQANADVLNVVLKYNPSSPRTWLGGHRDGQEFIWTDGSFWNFENWVSGQPDDAGNTEDCVEMNWKNLGEWNDDLCSKRKPFLCAFKWLKWWQQPED